jgi:hypothetical protein
MRPVQYQRVLAELARVDRDAHIENLIRDLVSDTTVRMTLSTR